ncbi:MAG: AAA family ATPase [Candidatus Absconditabacterales bacterium]
MSGKAGSGKGTISKLLAEKLGYEHISIGEIKRKLAHKMGLTISEFDILGEKPENKETFDLKYEEYQKNLDVNSKIILDGRMAFFCQPHSFKVFLEITDEEAARRIFNDKERLGDEYSSLDDVKNVTIKRNEENVKRFKDLYNIDIIDPNNFNFIISTKEKSPQQVADEIIIAFNEFQKQT